MGMFSIINIDTGTAQDNEDIQSSMYICSNLTSNLLKAVSCFSIVLFQINSFIFLTGLLGINPSNDDGT